MLNRRMTVLLFLSSYMPLFGLLALRSYNKSDAVFSLSLALLGTAMVGLAGFLLSAALTTTDRHRVLEAEQRDGDVAAYAATYLLPFLTVAEGGWRDVLALAIFIAIIGILYVNSSMVYVNPILAACGYHLYRVKTTTAPAGDAVTDVRRWLVIKADVRVGEAYAVRHVAGSTLFAYPWDNDDDSAD